MVSSPDPLVGKASQRALIPSSGYETRWHVVCTAARILPVGNSYAFPAFRTPDVDEALRVVNQLLELADTSQLELDFDIAVTSTRTLTRLLALLPEADWWCIDPGQEEQVLSPSSQRGDDPYTSLPIHFQHWCVPPEYLPPILAAVGSEMAAIRWDFTAWPAVPELKLDSSGKCAYITVSINARTIWPDESSPDHTVHIHAAEFYPERATWLAAQVGLEIIGDPEMSAL
ncbi:hypothetical protein AB0H00_31105 [Nocardia sp. NPDC023852]|uniref:hypothetical protein n=1 Tax=Nocardia sp. NPDC023852 TaxID=3154697 RepID=UPI0033C6840B